MSLRLCSLIGLTVALLIWPIKKQAFFSSACGLATNRHGGVKEQALSDRIYCSKYRPFKWRTFAGDFFNSLKAFIGTNYQALPFAFAQSGLGFGLAGVFIIASLTDHCLQIMLRCKNTFIEQICSNSLAVNSVDRDDVPRLRERLQLSVGYGDIGQRVYGSWCYHLIQFAVWFTQFTTCISYFIFIGNTVFEMFPLKDINSQNISTTVLDFFEYSMRPLNDVLNGVTLTGLSHQLPSDAYYPSNVSNATSNSQQPSMFSTPAVDQFSTSSGSNSTALFVNTAPDLRIIIVWCVPVFIVTSLVRKMRYLAPMSFIATIALILGIVSVLAFLIKGFTVGNFEWYRFATLPLFLNQLISAYEGIGCILPIHASMVGCRHMLRYYIHVNVYIIFVILSTFGTLGYLRYGPDVQQIIVKEITQHTLLSLLVDATLVVSVIFTYPLQCFPVIEITESYLLTKGGCCPKKRFDRLEYDEITVEASTPNISVTESSPLRPENASVELTASQVSTTVSLPSVPRWKRNMVRITLTVVIALLAVVLRDNYAYVSSFTGAVGASLLSFILPCLLELKLRGTEMSLACIVKDIVIIVFAILVSIAGLVSIVISIAQGHRPK